MVAEAISDIENISAGPYHTCARLEDGSVKCWGHDGLGKLRYGDKINRGNAHGEMGDQLLAVDFGARGYRGGHQRSNVSHLCAP